GAVILHFGSVYRPQNAVLEADDVHAAVLERRERLTEQMALDRADAPPVGDDEDVRTVVLRADRRERLEHPVPERLEGLAARLLAAEGARVVTCGRSREPAVGEALHVAADLGEAGEPERVVAEAVAALGGLDVLVNNVGVARLARFEDVPDQEWDDYWRLNV